MLYFIFGNTVWLRINVLTYQLDSIWFDCVSTYQQISIRFDCVSTYQLISIQLDCVSTYQLDSIRYDCILTYQLIFIYSLIAYINVTTTGFVQKVKHKFPWVGNENPIIFPDSNLKIYTFSLSRFEKHTLFHV